MNVGDHVYVITDQLQTGSGIPGIIYAVQDSTVEVVVESIHGPEIFRSRTPRLTFLAPEICPWANSSFSRTSMMAGDCFNLAISRGAISRIRLRASFASVINGSQSLGSSLFSATNCVAN